MVSTSLNDFYQLGADFLQETPYFKRFSYNWRTTKPVTEASRTVLGNSTVVPNSNVVVGHIAFNRWKGWNWWSLPYSKLGHSCVCRTCHIYGHSLGALELKDSEHKYMLLPLNPNYLPFSAGELQEGVWALAACCWVICVAASQWLFLLSVLQLWPVFMEMCSSSSSFLRCGSFPICTIRTLEDVQSGY